MKEKRSLFNIVFGKKVSKIVGEYLQLMSGYKAIFSDSSEIEESLDAIKCIHTISKLVHYLV